MRGDLPIRRNCPGAYIDTAVITPSSLVAPNTHEKLSVKKIEVV